MSRRAYCMMAKQLYYVCFEIVTVQRNLLLCTVIRYMIVRPITSVA